ncbi:MAG: PP2C family protein-serine/threonine phosphatase [Acidobacteriia bacterium]|nr:PP2C family protein-serine/threonine phosphatase [Terriglobia bacterium]
MLSAVNGYVRRQFYLYWPWMGRLARVTAYFAAVDLLLLVIWSISLLAKPGGSASLLGWARFLAYVTGCLAAVLGLRWLRRKVMWRLRNRLIVTYVFIGVIPVILLLAIGVITAYLFAWQFATYVATSDFHTEISTLAAVNNRVAVNMADRIAKGAAPSEALLQQASGREPVYLDREITAWYRGKSYVLPANAVAAAPPRGAKEVRNFAQDGGRLLLRVADTVPAGKDELVLISNVPLDEKLLARVGARLGEVSVSLFSSNRLRRATDAKDKDANNRPQIVIGDERLDIKSDAAADTPAAVKAGKLPPPANRFDREITGGSLLKVLDWKSGQERTALLAVVTRPSLLYDRLFRTVGQSATFIMAVLVAVVALFGVIELLALFIGVRLTRTITRSVAALYRGTQQVNRGDFAHRIEILSEDQLAALESSFNSMTTSLERLLQEQKEKQRLENELVIAQEVQAQLFPRESADLAALELHGICRPARTVSGDYYDFLPMDSDKVGLAVGDVSGKGISAALLMATIHSAVRAYSLEAAVAPALPASVGGGGTAFHGSALAYANGDLSPAALMSLLNRQLYRSTPSEKYATLFFGTYDGHSCTVNYCNGGHLPPLVLHADGTASRLDAGGTVVGLFDGVNYDETQVALSPGDILVAYSDGITEPENDFGEFGEQRLVELVRENRNLPLARISDLVMSAVLDWIGGSEQPDDMTLVLARPR